MISVKMLDNTTGSVAIGDFDDTPCLSLLKHLIKVQGDAIK